MKFFITLILTLLPLLAESPFEALKRDYDRSSVSIESQVDALEESVERAENRVTLDEELRRRISNLYQSTTSNRDGKVEELLTKALEWYSHNEELIAEHQSENGDLALLHELAQDSEKMALYATQLEKSLGLKSWPKDKERCGMTARAILYHFLQNRDPEEIGSLMQTPLHTMEALRNHLELIANHSEERWIYYVDTSRLDHVFIFLQMEDGSFRMLQSFVNRYSLAAELTDLPALSYEEVQEIVSKIERLDQASEWNSELDKLYEELFLAPAPSDLIDDFSKEKPDFKFVAIPL